MHENGRREMGAPNHLATKNGLTEPVMQGHQVLHCVTRLVLAQRNRDSDSTFNLYFECQTAIASK